MGPLFVAPFLLNDKASGLAQVCSSLAHFSRHRPFTTRSRTTFAPSFWFLAASMT
jgi:hypothetical protein